MGTKKVRKGPTASATLFSIGTKKKGNDGNFWIVVATKANVHKWQKIKKITKTAKTAKTANNSTMKRCEDFCKNDYKEHIIKHREKNKKKYNYVYSATNKKDEFGYAICKKSYCNKKCEGLEFFGDNQKNIKNGFINTFSKKQVEMLKKRGALSGCMNARGETQLLGLG